MIVLLVAFGFLVWCDRLEGLLNRLDFKLRFFGAQGRSLSSGESVKLLSVGAHGVTVSFGGSSKTSKVE